MTVTKALPLTTRLGNVRIEDVTGVWDPWPGTVFGEVDFGDPSFNTQPIADDDDLFVVPVSNIITPGSPDRYRGVLWVDTGESSDEVDQQFYNFEGQSLHFRLLPAMNATSGNPWDNWISKAHAYDFGESGTANFVFVYIEINGDDLAGSPELFLWIVDDFGVDEEVSIAYDPDVHRWFRIRHDDVYGIVSIDTSPGSGLPWVEQLTSGVAVQSSMTSMTMEFVQEVFFNDANPASIGYLGELNQQPEEEPVPLTTAILPLALVPGGTTRTLPLTTEIEEIA